MDKKMKMVEAKSLAQKIAFAPFSFQAIKSMVDLGILKLIDESLPDGISVEDIEKKLNLNHYTVSTLLEVGTFSDVVELKDNKYNITKIGQCFLYDTMTKVNFNFVNDVCYQGMFYLKDSFVNSKPEGLKCFGDWKTIYEGLSSLPEDVKKSWFDFDHFYSDNSFEQVIKIILESNPKRVFDIGCNTGKFETAMFKNGYTGTMVMIDLQKQLNIAKQNMEKLNKVENCEFFPTNILDASLGLPNNPDVVLMSQFLDCFSLEEIVSILKKVKNVMLGGTKVFILEPFWDKQKFEAAKLSLTHISLYFTALANGNSKMYSCNEMLDCINKSGLRLSKIHENIGPFEYTLLECSK